jgi:hypothetical protein
VPCCELPVQLFAVGIIVYTTSVLLQLPLFNVSVCWIGFEQLELHADAPETPVAETVQVYAVKAMEDDSARFVCSPLQMEGALFEMVATGKGLTSIS